MYSTAQMQSITNARYERVCAFEETRLRVRGNAFVRSPKRVWAVQTNAFARCNKRTRTTRYASTKLLMTFDPHIIRKTYKVTVEREINVAASAKRVLATVKRHLKRRLRLRSLGEANAFVGGGERVCEEKRTRSHAEANAFELGDERVRKRRRTRSHAETNAVARERKRTFVIPCIWTVLYMYREYGLQGACM